MKPYVLCHMVMSVDGRIWGSRWRPKANVIPNLFERLHDELGGGSWLCGRVTAQEFAKGKGLVYPPTDQKFVRENWFATRDAKAWGVFLDAERGEIGELRRGTAHVKWRIWPGFDPLDGESAPRFSSIYDCTSRSPLPQSIQKRWTESGARRRGRP